MTDERFDQGSADPDLEPLEADDLEDERDSEIDVEDEAPAAKRRGPLWWAGAVAATLLGIAVVLALLGVLLYNFGTMETPSAEVQAQYEQLVASGQVKQVDTRSPGFRIPIPGCKCHAADPDIASKSPGRVPDPSIVMAHRYRTISQCGQCHGGTEPKGVEGQRLEDAPAQ